MKHTLLFCFMLCTVTLTIQPVDLPRVSIGTAPTAMSLNKMMILFLGFKTVDVLISKGQYYCQMITEKTSKKIEHNDSTKKDKTKNKKYRDEIFKFECMRAALSIPRTVTLGGMALIALAIAKRVLV